MDQREIELHIYHKTSVKVFRPHQISPSCLGSMSLRPMDHAVMDSGRNLLYPSYIWMPAQLSVVIPSRNIPVWNKLHFAACAVCCIRFLNLG